MKKKILIVGVGGRTATLFAEELKDATDIIGVCRRHSCELIENHKILIFKNGISSPKIFKCHIVYNELLKEVPDVDFIFISTKNPISSVVRFYYGKFGNKLPDLILSQNGFNAAEDAFEEIKRTLGDDRYKSIRIIRVALFNAVSKNSDSVISYSLPIRIAVGVAYGKDNMKDLLEIFTKSQVEASYVPQQDVKNMEYSKLFTNLIGIPSYSHHLNIEEGFKKKGVFIEEIKALREYIMIVKAAGGRFLNFDHYPIKIYASIVEHMPIYFLVLFRRIVAKMILKNRSGKNKGNIDEIDYYNGAIVALGKKLGIRAVTNEKIINRIKQFKDR